jgi:hypothetical protein
MLAEDMKSYTERKLKGQDSHNVNEDDLRLDTIKEEEDEADIEAQNKAIFKA